MSLHEFKLNIEQAGLKNREDEIIEIIYRIGTGQDIAWRRGEGILQSDLKLDKKLLDFLYPVYIKEPDKKYKNDVYILTRLAGYEVYKEILQDKIIDTQFSQAIKDLNPKLLEIIVTGVLNIDSLPLNFKWLENIKGERIPKYRHEFTYLQKNTRFGEKFYSELRDVTKKLMEIHQNEKYGIIIKSFNSTGPLRDEYLLRPEYHKIFTNHLKSDITKYSSSLLDLSKAVERLDSLETSHARMKPLDIAQCSDILDELQKDKIIFKRSMESPYFGFLNKDEFIKRITNKRQNLIEEITTPIIVDITGSGEITYPTEKKIERKNDKEIPLQSKKLTQKNAPASDCDIIIGSKEKPLQYGIFGKCNGRNVILDLNSPHIVFVSGMMGSGKGYTIGVISEMLVSDNIPNISQIGKKATIIVFYDPKDDTKSEFWSIRYANDNLKEIKSLRAFEAEPARIIEENKFCIFIDPTVFNKAEDKKTFEEEYNTQNVFPLYFDPATLVPEDWSTILTSGSSSNQLYIKEIFKILRNIPTNFHIEDLRKRINESELNKSQKKYATLRVEILQEYLKKDDFLSKLAIGGVNIIDFRKAFYEHEDIFSIMALIMSKLQNKVEFTNEPFIFIINEAHLYFKKGISKDFVDNIDNLIRRKRHGANWLLLDTHLPEDVDSKVVKLSDLKITHFTDKTVDSKVLKLMFKGQSEDLSNLETGEAILLANQSSLGLSTSIKVKVRPRISKHGGETKTAVQQSYH